MLFLGLSVLWFLFIWSLWERVLTEYTRNYLFDLRDELRAWFIEKGYGLEHPSYGATREMLNATIWHISKASYWEYLIFKIAAQKNPEWATENREIVNRKFFSGHREIDEYVHSVRSRSTFALGSYITLKSFIILFFSAVMGIFSLFDSVLTGAWKRIAPNFNDFISPVPSLLRTTFFYLFAFALPITAPGRGPESNMMAWSVSARTAASARITVGQNYKEAV